MKKALRLLFCFLLLQFSLTHQVYAAKKLKVGVYDKQPLVFVDGNGNVQGFLIDILEHIGSKEKWQIDYVAGSWAECLKRLEKGEIDLLVGTEYSRERNEVYDFTYESVFSDWGVIYTQKNQKLNQIIHLDNKKIAVVHDDIHYYNLSKLPFYKTHPVSCQPMPEPKNRRRSVLTWPLS